MSGAEECRVSVETGGGRTLHLRFETEDDHIAGVIRTTKTFYEAEMLADIRSRVFFAERAVDVGAHVGNHTLYFAYVLGLRTIAFEPNATSFGHLSENVEANGLHDVCEVRNAAIGAKPGNARPLEAIPSNSGTARLEMDPAGCVPVTTLDSEVLGQPRIDLLKIDVEGWEVDVLRGAAGTLARHRPLVYVEVARQNFETLSALMISHSYVCWKRFNHTPTFLYLPRERLGKSPRGG